MGCQQGQLVWCPIGANDGTASTAKLKNTALIKQAADASTPAANKKYQIKRYSSM